MPTLIESLKEYITTTSREEILEKWEATKPFDSVEGPVIPQTKFIVGNKVYCSCVQRHGIISRISTKEITHPITVKFENGTSYYTLDGKYYIDDEVSLSPAIEDKLNKLLKL